MNLSMRLKIFIGLFYVCWFIGIIVQITSIIIFGTKFGIIFRTSIGFSCVFLFCVYRWFIFWRLANVPFVPVEYPYFFGNISSCTHLAETFAEFYKNYGMEHKIIGISMLFEPVVLITDLKLARSVLKENFQYFQDRGMYQNEKDDPLSTVLGSLNGNKWHLLRQKLTPAFSPTQIKHMLPIIKTVGDEFVRALNEIVATENQVEIRCLFSRFATEIIGK